MCIVLCFICKYVYNNIWLFYVYLQTVFKVAKLLEDGKHTKKPIEFKYKAEEWIK